MENFAPLIFKGLGWAIIHSLWVGALLYGVLILAFQVRNWRAKTKSLLLAVALYVLLACFCLTFLYHMVDHAAARSVTVLAADRVFLQLLDYSSPVPFKAYVEHYFPVMIAFYTLGVLFQLVIVINSFHKLNMIRRKELLDVPESWKALLARKKQQMGLRMPIAFQLSALVDVPVVIGHLKPIILFPMALFSGISMDQVEAVLIHELAHIKRNDYLVNLVKTITETLLFFNPFVWLIGRMLEMERENACDDVVVNLTSKPIHYARTLLWLEEHRQQPNHSLAMQAIDKKKQLLHRIQRMTNMKPDRAGSMRLLRTNYLRMKKNYLNAKHKLAILTLMLGCIASLAWVKPFVQGTALIETSTLPSAADERADFSGDSVKVVTIDTAAKDTLPTRREPYITFIDKDGTTLTFDRYEDLSDSLKTKVDHGRRLADSIRIVYSSSAWKEKLERMRLSRKERDSITAQVHRHMDSLNKLFDSKEWKEGFAAIAQNTDIIRGQADSIRAYFDSSAWKEKLRAHADSMSTFFNSPEGKKAREQLKQQLEDNKANITEWRDMIIQQDQIMQRYMDSLRLYFNSPEWKSKMDRWKKESKGKDTTLVWPTMTITGQKHHVEQLLEQRRVMEQYQALNQEALATLQQQYASINEDKARKHEV